MATLKQGIALCLVMLALSSGASAAGSQPASSLGGSWQYQIPQGFAKVPAQQLEDPQAAAAGMSTAMYISEATQQAVVVSEMPVPLDAMQQGERAFLDKAVTGSADEQASRYEDFKTLSERQLDRNGLAVRQLDGQGAANGQPLLTTTLIATARQRMAVIHLVSPAQPVTVHEALVGVLNASR